MGHALACQENKAFYRRHLPHWQPERSFLFITWRLEGSLPSHLRTRIAEETPGQAFRRIDQALDQAATGPQWLKDPLIAGTVVNALGLGENRKLYRLSAFVVMPNHVHALLQPLVPLAKVTHWVKGYTAYEANRILGRKGGAFWQHESYDHWVRNEDEYSRIMRYIEFNPVSAGLVGSVQEWAWSSAKTNLTS